MSDALERLRNRNRPTVPTRDASLISAAPAPPASTPPSTISFDISTSRYPDSEVSTVPEAKPQESEPPLQTKQSTMRLEQGLSDRLQEVCRENSISREVLIEALFEYGEAHPDVLKAVLSQAKLKNEHRQQIANLKRAKSMMEKFG
jgi:hypothetical protein